MQSLQEQNIAYKNHADKGLISRIQKYSTKDGPGIRTTVFFKGCPLHCLWCSNPELISLEQEILSDPKKCVLCGSCIKACPQNAILQKDGKTYIKRDICSKCGICEKICPKGVYELIGTYITQEDLLKELIKDEVFYNVSGGGVTFSGGEPVLQYKFLKKVAEGLKEHKIHVALETAGYVPWGCFEEILSLIDLVLYDIKTTDKVKHEKLTGGNVDIILKNALKMSELNIPMIIRLVLIPGYNDSREDVIERLNFIRKLNSVKRVDILPYHRLGAAKYNMLGQKYLLKDLKEPEEQFVDEIKSMIESFGYKVSIGG